MGFWGFGNKDSVFTIFSLPLYQGLAKEKMRCEERSYIEALQKVFLLPSVEHILHQKTIEVVNREYRKLDKNEFSILGLQAMRDTLLCRGHR